MKIEKPIRLIELFAGYGSQALALKYMGVSFEHWKVCEWNWKSNYAYALLHDMYFDHSQKMTKAEIIRFLQGKGISSNWNTPMTDDQIAKMKEEDLRCAYNSIVSTKNTVDISKTHAEDLTIEREREREHFYLLTYSFPCQDLSMAGNKLGMAEGSHTRSSLLWEVARILRELCERGERPDALMMENVPQVHGKGNKESFDKWCTQLEEMGYKNFRKDLIATDYGIPQTRKRCFMVSIKGGSAYSFQEPIPLKKKLKDFLLDSTEIDEKYYLTGEQIENITTWKSNVEKRFEKNDDGNARTLSTRAGANGFTCNYIKCEVLGRKANAGNYKANSFILGVNGAVSTLDSSNFKHPKTVAIENKRLAKTINQNELRQGEEKALDLYNQKAKSAVPTLTMPNHNSVALWNGYRVRKLLPKECFRLMGVKDEDFEKLQGKFPDTTLYHLAGDSIVTNVIMAVLGNLFERGKYDEKAK